MEGESNQDDQIYYDSDDYDLEESEQEENRSSEV